MSIFYSKELESSAWNAADTYEKEINYTHARDKYLLALSIHRSQSLFSQSPYTIAVLLEKIGDMYIKNGQYKEAKDKYQESQQFYSNLIRIGSKIQELDVSFVNITKKLMSTFIKLDEYSKIKYAREQAKKKSTPAVYYRINSRVKSNKTSTPTNNNLLPDNYTPNFSLHLS